MDFNEKEFHSVVLGALLHDIGKFVQRAQKEPKKQDHSHWGDEWFENKLAEKLTPAFGKNIQIIRSAIGNHHEHEEIITLADSISAGMDRISLRDEEEGDPFTDRLISIFSKIFISEKPKSEKYSRLTTLGDDQLREIFPISQKECSQKEYWNLLNNFEDEIRHSNFEQLSTEDIINFFHFLIWKYCWCIPSASYKDEPDVPLFDHLRTTGAIATCLYLYKQENPGENLNVENKSFCLVGGDISGIQSYIFDVLTQQGKVAKRLRARSLFVQIASEIASHKVLHAFRLSLCNLILSAGGNFYILVPNLKKSFEIIKALQEEFDFWSLKQLKGELSVTLAVEELSGKDLIGKDSTNFLLKLENLKQKQSQRKYHPLGSALKQNEKWVIGEFVRPEVVEGDEKACQGCHKFPINEPIVDEDNFCERCSNDVRVGKLLPKVKYLVFFKDHLHEFSIFNYSFELWDDISLKKKEKEKPYLILALNDTKAQLPVLGFKYIANHIPTTLEVHSSEIEEGQPVTFSDIASVSEGDKLIAYLKGDVDNMGKILREGFRKTKTSISRFAALSRLLETFFGGYLQTKMETEFKEVYSIFSGGDDFFIAGPWNRAIEFAKEARKEFSLFCAENPDFTFSAGLLLAKPHEPISYCAELVEKELKESKGKEVKNNITLFNQTVTWNELERILAEGKKIIDWLKREPPVVTRSFVHNLRKYGEMARESRIFEGEVKTEYLKFIPMLVYDLKRNLSKEKQKEALTWAEDLIPNIDKPTGGSNLPILKPIMDYVLTYTRS